MDALTLWNMCTVFVTVRCHRRCECGREKVGKAMEPRKEEERKQGLYLADDADERNVCTNIAIEVPVTMCFPSSHRKIYTRFSSSTLTSTIPHVSIHSLTAHTS